MRLLILASLLLPTAALAQPGAPPPPPPPPGYAPAYAQQAPNHKHGMTFEANLGLGFMWAASDGDSTDTEVALGGLNLGIGGWINPQLAVTLRIAGVTYSEDVGSETGRLTVAFGGPSVQYWVNENAWVGGGAGLGVLAASVGDESESESGLGLDLRAGYTFSTQSENTFNVSVELTPTFLELGGQDVTFYGFGILFGYQHL